MSARTGLITTAAAFTLSILGCSERPKDQPTAGEAPESAAVANGEDGPANPTDVDLLGAGTYTVCDIGSHAQHNNVTFPHLQWGEKVVIGELDEVTHVQLGKHARDLIRFANGKELAGLSEFPHSTGSQTMAHLVRIRSAPDYVAPSAPPNEPCDKRRTIIAIQFCVPAAEQSRWQCVGEDDEHFGDTHAQN